MPPTRAFLVGHLDPGQRETLTAVLRLGEATGAALEREHPETKATAWNNRLRDLYERERVLKHKKSRAVSRSTAPLSRRSCAMGENFVEEQVKNFERR